MIDEPETAVVVRDLALASAGPKQLERGEVHAWLAGGQVHKIDLTGDQYRDFPEHKRGTVTVRDVASFAQYHGKHADVDSEVFADLDRGTVTAVLDAHRSRDAYESGDRDAARWQQHRLVLALQHTEPWNAWTALDGRLVAQAPFAEFIEENARYIVAPDAKAATSADLLDVVQNFQAHTSVAFQSGHRIANGQTQFAYVEETTATAKTGGRGTIEVPNQFSVAIVPYDDCDPKMILARFRYRISDGTLLLGFKLDDAKGVARDAVREVTGKLAEACNVTVMHGQPA